MAANKPLAWTAPAFLLFVSKELLQPRLERCGEVVLKEARKLVDSPKSGQQRTTRDGIRYRSSSEGEPFASPTAEGRDSLETEAGLDGFLITEPAVRVGTNHGGIVRHILGLDEGEGQRDPLVPALTNKKGECIEILKGR